MSSRSQLSRAVVAVLVASSALLIPGFAATSQPASAALSLNSQPVTSSEVLSEESSSQQESASSPVPVIRVVQPGETLTSIARSTGISGGWPALYDANRDAVGPSPDLLVPGTVLVVPTAPPAAPGQGVAATSPSPSAQTTYRVEPGDTLEMIAERAEVEGGWAGLYAANRAVIGADPDRLRVDTELVLPVPGAASPRPEERPEGHPAEPPVGMPAPSAAPEGSGSSSTAPSPSSPQPVPSMDGTAAPVQPPGPAGEGRASQAVDDDAQGPPDTSPVPGWALWPLVLAALVALVALIVDPLVAWSRRVQARRPATANALDLVPGLGADVAAPPVTRVHVEQHPVLLVSYSAVDDLVIILVPRGQDVATVLQVARVVLPEAAYRAAAIHLPVQLRAMSARRRSLAQAG